MSSKTNSTTEKNDFEKVTKILEEALANIKHDRKQVSVVLDKFVNNDDDDKIMFSADSVARLADSLVKNNQLMVSIATLISKKIAVESDEVTAEDLFENIGSPYSKEDLS